MAEKEVKLDQDGKMINPHNPDFITKVPWYLGNSGPTLKHHAVQKVDHFLSLTESDALIEQKLAARKASVQTAPKTSYRKGACKNCGAMSHTEKDCVERPRSTKKSAWKSGLDIAADEVTMKLEDHGKVSYDAKRDQWKGYDPVQYQTIIDKHERLEEERVKQLKESKEAKRQENEAQLREKKLEKEQKKLARRQRADGLAKDANKSAGKSTAGNKGSDNDSDHSDSDSDSDSDYGSDEDDEGGEVTHKDFVERDEEARDFQGTMAPQGGIGGNGMRQTVRNLRLREDTPKYLRNLALDSAFYDPKSRAMRANPLPDENPEDLAFAGDNFIRYSGDAIKLAQNQLLCWEMQSRGEDIDMMSNPSQAELTQRQFAEKKQKLEESKKAALLEKYGNGSAATPMDPRLRLGQTESYVEYNREGRVIKGAAPVVVARTKYDEDVYVNNHTAVWGSYYNRARAVWGYHCCHSSLRNSYCTGPKGRQANDAANSEAMDAFQARKMLDSNPKRTAESANGSALTKRSDIFGESNAASAGAIDATKLEKARRRAEEESASASAASSAAAATGPGDERKRGYNSMQNVEVSVEDMEVYRMKRTKADDPMAALMDSEEVLDYKK